MTALELYIRQFRSINSHPVSWFRLAKNFWRWKSLLGVKSLDAGLPWMTFDAIDKLYKIVNPAMRVFEYGSGGSTLFFAMRVAEVISVEHDAEWMKVVEEKIKSSGIKSWTGMLHLPEKGAALPGMNPAEAKDYTSSDKNYIGCTFKKYSTAIAAYPDQSFDLVVIDGRARPSCVMHAVPKVKSGGWLILDNTDRTSYHPAIHEYINPYFKQVLGTFGPTTFIPGFNMTSIWQKR